MSSLTSPSPARLRAPRAAGEAFEKARLALVPPRRSTAPRAPFAVLVFVVLGLGVVGLLVFNTHMQQTSFYATKLEKEAEVLQAQRQDLEMELEQMRDPQAVAAAAKRIGMVAPPNPATLDLGTGQVLGAPASTDVGDGVRIRPNKSPYPFNVKPIRVHVTLPPSGDAAGGGPASPENPVTPGTTGRTPQNTQQTTQQTTRTDQGARR